MATNPLLNPALASRSNVLTQMTRGNQGPNSNFDAFGSVAGQLGGLGYDTSSFMGMQGDGSEMGTQTPAVGDYAAAEQWLKANGLQVAQQPLGGDQFANYLVDSQGQVIGEPFIGSNKDSAFQFGMLAAAAIASGGIASWAGGGAGAGLSGMDLAADAAFGSGNNILSAGLGASGGIPLTAAEMGVGSFPAGMEGYGFMPASGAAAEGATLGTAAGGYGGLTGGGLLTGNAGATLGAEGLGSLGLSAGGYGGLGEAGGVMAGLSGAGGGGGGLLSTLGSANSLANLASAGIGLYGQNKAIGAMQDATNQANDFNRYAFDTIRADNKPLVDMRNSVLPQIQSLLANPGSIASQPDYQFGYDQGAKALRNQGAASGMTYSGQQGKALQRYGQDYAGTKLDQSLNRLTTVAGLGQVGSNSNNAATANYGANAAGNALNMGNARGSAYAGMAQGVNNALLNIFDPWQYGRVNGGP